jgi:putative membrane protein insertion efficiency factor
VARLFMLLIRGYQLTLSRMITFLFGNVCRFTPSCSAYAYECLRMHGMLRGGLLSVKRLGKCHPFHPGGHDPPPRPKSHPRTSELPQTK